MIDHDWIQKSLAEQSGSYKIKPEESKEACAWLVKSSSLISQKKKGGEGCCQTEKQKQNLKLETKSEFLNAKTLYANKWKFFFLK